MPAPPAVALSIVAVLLAAACGPGADGGAAAGTPPDAGASVDAAATAAGSDERPWRGQELAEPRARPDFVLSDTDGEPYDFRAETRGKVALLFFGYTHCPDICPVHLANLSEVLRNLPREISGRVEVVFVTVDPERDTPERLRDFLGRMQWRISGLRGTREQVNEIETALELPRSTITRLDDGSVSVGHYASVLAFGADGPARLAYPWGTRQRDWQVDLPRLVRETTRAPPAAPGA
ncbi:MAG: SCO family protein [Gemmatimonadota bacterium]